jgi:hypothetical protein
MKDQIMLESDQYYLAREADARSAAGEQALENVRQKHLTAAATWAALAHSARKMAELRARRLVERTVALPAAEGH